jgi:hypothetical protein
MIIKSTKYWTEEDSDERKTTTNHYAALKVEKILVNALRAAADFGWKNLEGEQRDKAHALYLAIGEAQLKAEALLFEFLSKQRN